MTDKESDFYSVRLVGAPEPINSTRLLTALAGNKAPRRYRARRTSTRPWRRSRRWLGQAVHVEVTAPDGHKSQFEVTPEPLTVKLIAAAPVPKPAGEPTPATAACPSSYARRRAASILSPCLTSPYAEQRVAQAIDEERRILAAKTVYVLTRWDSMPAEERAWVLDKWGAFWAELEGHPPTSPADPGAGVRAFPVSPGATLLTASKEPAEVLAERARIVGWMRQHRNDLDTTVEGIRSGLDVPADSPPSRPKVLAERRRALAWLARHQYDWDQALGRVIDGTAAPEPRKDK